jgi:hypothetical protein
MTVTDTDTHDLEQQDPPRTSLFGRAFKIVVVVVLVGILVVVAGLATLLPHLSNPFKSRTTDRSQPALLLSIKDIARFDAATGNFQVLVDVQKDKSYLPDFIYNDRTLLVAAGSVDAYVDFSTIGAGDAVASADRKTATLYVPVPVLESPVLDLKKSYVYENQRGLVNRVGDVFSSDPNKLQAVYSLANQKLTAAAVSSKLVDAAETNTRTMLQHLLTALGFTTVTVTFRSA